MRCATEIYVLLYLLTRCKKYCKNFTKIIEKKAGKKCCLSPDPTTKIVTDYCISVIKQRSKLENYGTNVMPV